MTKRSRKSKEPRRRRSVSTRTRTVYRRARDFMSGKIRWGEAALAAIVGYEGDKILAPVTGPIFDATPNNSTAGHIMNAMAQASGNAFDKAVNKSLGTLAVAKVAYDAVRKGRLDQNDLSLYLPFALGTAFDAPGGSGKSGSEVW